MGLSVNTYKSVNIFTNKVVLNINVHGARRYALKKRVLKRWIYSHGYTQREVAKKLHMTTEKFKRKLSRKETFMCRHNHGGTNSPCGKGGKHHILKRVGRFEKRYVV